MAKANATWKVLPHGPLEQLSERLWRVEGSLEGMPLKRVMTVIRRADGSLLIHNAIALDAAAMAELEARGPVRTLVVPNAFHRLDAGVFHARYPDAAVVCPPGARAKVTEVVPVTRTYADEPADGAVELVTLDGTKGREGVVIVRDGGGTSLVFNDAVFNMPHVGGFSGFVFRHVTASTGGPRVSRLMKLLAISDTAAFRAHLERLAALPDLRRIVVSHHETITDDPAGTLARVAAAL